MQKRQVINRIMCILIAVAMLFCIIPLTLRARAESKTVRVGMFDSALNSVDEQGRRSGYAYDFLQEIAGHTGWKYEYVEDSWETLMKMLEKGEIDIISDVSHLPEREGKMLFSAYSMGEERFFIFTKTDDSEVSYDAQSLNGKIIGVSAYSNEQSLLEAWTSFQGIETQIVSYPGDNELAEALKNKEIYAFVATDAFISYAGADPLFQIGSSEIYFAINKNRPDLKEDIDKAMRKIDSVNPYFIEELTDKYILSGVSHYLDADEKTWLDNHKVIKVGYRADYMAFCGVDEKTGNLTGALKDYLELAAEVLHNADISFEAVAYETIDEAIEALKKDEIDCVFPLSMSKYDAEIRDILITRCAMEADMYAVVRNSKFNSSSDNKVAVNKGNSNYRIFLEKYFPNWTVIEYDNSNECIEQIGAGYADVMLITNYRISSVSKLLLQYKLTTVSIGYPIELSFGVNRDNEELYSILNRIIMLIPESSVYAALTNHTIANIEPSFADWMHENIRYVLVFLLIFIVLILFQLYKAFKVAKKEKLQKARLQEALDNYKQADYDRRTDFLTGLHNRQDMFELLQDTLSGKRENITAMYMMDIDNFKAFNDNFGHTAGDECLKKVGAALKAFGQEKNIRFYRYGGEEILGISFSNDGLEDVIAEEIVRMIFELDIERNDVPLGRVTVSLGYTNDNRRYEKMIDKADSAMYKAKSNGKNCCCSYEQMTDN